MWLYVLLICFLVSTVQCQTYQQQVNDKLAAMESSRATAVASFNGLRSNLLALQSAIVTLNSALSTAVYNDILSESISMMDVLAADQIGKPDSGCFAPYLSARPTIIPSAQQTLNLCTLLVNSRATQQIVSLNTNIASLNSAAAVARPKLTSCNTIRFQATPTLFDYCTKSATSDFNSKVTASTATVTDQTTKKNNLVNDLTGCVSNTVIFSQNQLNLIIGSVASCLQTSTSSDAPQLVTLLPTVTVNQANFIGNQVINPTTSSVALNTAKNDYNLAIDNAKKAVDTAISVKALNLVSAKTTLENTFVTTKTAFDQAVTDKSSELAAASCVNNIRNALANNINKYTNEYVTCVTSIRSGSLSLELMQIQNLYNEAVAKEGDTVMQCLSQTGNLVSDSGITQCRGNADADAATYATYLNYRALTLFEEATLVGKAGDRCKDITTNNIKRKNQKDKQLFENCIYRTTKIQYTINLP